MLAASTLGTGRLGHAGVWTDCLRKLHPHRARQLLQTACLDRDAFAPPSLRNYGWVGLTAVPLVHAGGVTARFLLARPETWSWPPQNAVDVVYTPPAATRVCHVLVGHQLNARKAGATEVIVPGMSCGMHPRSVVQTKYYPCARSGWFAALEWEDWLHRDTSPQWTVPPALLQSHETEQLLYDFFRAHDPPHLG